VFGCAAEAHHSIRGIFEQLFCQDVFDLCGQDAFDLCGERVVIVVGIAANFMVLYVDRHPAQIEMEEKTMSRLIGRKGTRVDSQSFFILLLSNMQRRNLGDSYRGLTKHPPKIMFS
jgi:hypothetical protein